MQHTGIIMIRPALRKAKGFHRSIWKILRLQNTKSSHSPVSQSSWYYLKTERLSKFTLKKKMNSTHKKCVFVTFKWLWQLDLSGQSVVSLTKWVTCLGRSQRSFSLLLLSLWCACLHFQMPPLCTCRRTESCLTGKENKKNLHLDFSLNHPPCRVDTPKRVRSPHLLRWLLLQLLQSCFFFYIIVNIFMSPPDSMSG